MRLQYQSLRHGSSLEYGIALVSPKDVSVQEAVISIHSTDYIYCYFQSKPLEPGLLLLPLFYAVTIAINAFSIFYKGSQCECFTRLLETGTYSCHLFCNLTDYFAKMTLKKHRKLLKISLRFVGQLTTNLQYLNLAAGPRPLNSHGLAKFLNCRFDGPAEFQMAEQSFAHVLAKSLTQLEN